MPKKSAAIAGRLNNGAFQHDHFSNHRNFTAAVSTKGGGSRSPVQPREDFERSCGEEHFGSFWGLSVGQLLPSAHRKLEAFADVSDVDGLDTLEAVSGLDCKIGVSWFISVLDGLDFRTRCWRLATIKVTKA